MNEFQLSVLLTKFSLVDNRKITPETVNTWFDVLGDLDFEFAYEAGVEHFRESTDYLQPAHIFAGAKKLQRKNTSDVREARDRGIIGADWPESKKLSAAATEALTADRATRHGVMIGGTWFESHDAYRQRWEERTRNAIPSASNWVGSHAEPADAEYLR